MHLSYLAEHGEVILFANLEHGEPETGPNITFQPFHFRRLPAPWSDLKNLIGLYRLIKNGGFDEVYTISPKGGLLGVLAAKAARVPVRVHFFTGQVWVTKSGVYRELLRVLDRAIGGACTHALIDSPSQREFLERERILPTGKGQVLGIGSIKGVDTKRFRPSADVNEHMRLTHGISASSLVVTFIGRLSREKGVLELVQAFSLLTRTFQKADLVLVGADEGMEGRIRQEIESQGIADKVHLIGLTDRPEKYLAMSDIFCLPSYREGFPVAALEAASSGVPIVASRIYGISDAVIDGETGLLHEPRSVGDISDKIARLAQDPKFRLRLGEAGRKRCLDRFSEETILSEFKAFERSLAEPVA